MRLDFDELTFFVSVFRNPDSLHAHNHEDTLSYVIYCGTDEVLVDPGRSSFSPGNRVATGGPAHNGLCDAAIPIAPLRRFFITRRIRTEPAVAGAEASGAGVRLWALNRSFGLRKELHIQRDGAGGVIVEERLESSDGLERPSFSHLFADVNVAQESNTSVRHVLSGRTIIYEKSNSPRLVLAERSPEYGRREPCMRAVVPFSAGGTRAMVRWRINAT